MGHPVVARMAERLPALLADVEALVTCESPSADLAAVAHCADIVAGIGTRELGAEPERIVLDGRSHLRWRLGPGEPRVLLLGHHDTVWPIGSLGSHPYQIEEGVLRGPGCFDMKTGVVMAFYAAAEALRASAGGLTILITGDEEVGSPSSRGLIEEAAAGCRAALVLESSADGGALKTERKGVSLYRVRVEGRAAHAGLEPERGLNAGVELAHQLLAVNEFGDVGRGTTVTPTAATVGTTTNTVPARAEVAVDVRVRDTAEQDRVDAAMRSLRPRLDGTRIEIIGGRNRPPLEAEASAALFAQASALADELGLAPLVGVAVGGGSDGNFTAGVGVPTLDGLGAVGAGAHADHEHVLVDEVPGRTALVAALLIDLLAGSDGASATNPGANSGAGRP